MPLSFRPYPENWFCVSGHRAGHKLLIGFNYNMSSSKHPMEVHYEQTRSHSVAVKGQTFTFEAHIECRQAIPRLKGESAMSNPSAILWL